MDNEESEGIVVPIIQASRFKPIEHPVQAKTKTVAPYKLYDSTRPKTRIPRTLEAYTYKEES